MPDLAIHVLSEDETADHLEALKERLASIANELRSLRRAEQNAQFEMGRLLCEVAGSSLSALLPMREGRKDVALWAKREVGLSYSRTAELMDAWRIKERLVPGLNEPTSEAQLRPLRPLLKHGTRGKALINLIWEKACEQSNRPEGPSRSLVAKIAREEAPDIIGKKKRKRSRSKREALDAIRHLEERYEPAALKAALAEYLKGLA